MSNNLLVKAGFALCVAMHQSGAEAMGKKIATIVEKHAIGTSAAALGSAWLPGVGSSASMVACAGFIWSMYYRINTQLGIPFAKNILKSVATAIGTNLAAGAVGALAISSAFSFIPGLGSIGASMIMAGTCYATTFASGLVYLKVLTRLAQSNADFSNIGEAELKATAKEVMDHEDIKGMMKEAKSQFKEAKERGDIRKGGGEVEPLEDGE